MKAARPAVQDCCGATCFSPAALLLRIVLRHGDGRHDRSFPAGAYFKNRSWTCALSCQSGRSGGSCGVVVAGELHVHGLLVKCVIMR